MATEDNVDISGIIGNLQKLVLNLSQEHALDKTTRSASRIRNMANCPDGSLSIRSPKFPVDPSAQLGDLQQQNLHLKNQYEDCIIALNSMMHVHRLEMMRFVNTRDTSVLSELISEELQEEIQEEKIPLPVFQDLDDVFHASGVNQTRIIEEIERLKFENALIRELVQMEDFECIDVDALLEKIENQTPLATSPQCSSTASEPDLDDCQQKLKSQETIKAKEEEQPNNDRNDETDK